MVKWGNQGGQTTSEFTLIMGALLLLGLILAGLMLNPQGGAVPTVDHNVSEKIAND